MRKYSTNKAKSAGSTNRVIVLPMISLTAKTVASSIKSGPKDDSLNRLMTNTKRLLFCHNIVSKRVFNIDFSICQAFY